MTNDATRASANAAPKSTDSPNINRRTALARMATATAALAVGTGPALAAHRKSEGDHTLSRKQAASDARLSDPALDDAFGDLIRRWEAAHDRIERACKGIDCKNPTKAADREWKRAMDKEDAAVAALLSFVPRNGREERRKARYILSKRFCYEIQPEQWDYLLQAMLRARA